MPCADKQWSAQKTLLITLWNMASALLQQSHNTDPVSYSCTEMCCSGFILIKQILTDNGKTVLRCTLEWYIGYFLFWINHWTFVDVGWDQVYQIVFFCPLAVMEDCDRCVQSILFYTQLKAARYLLNIRTNCSLRGNKVEMEDVCDFTSDSLQRLVLRSSACQNLQRQVWNQVLWKSLWNPPL